MTASTDEEEAYLALQAMLLELKQDSLNLFDINSTQEALVRDIAAMSPCLAQANACNILYIVFNESCVPDSGARHQQAVQSPDEKNFIHSAITSGYLGNNVPNPFNNSTVIPYILPDGVKKAFINIYTITGKRLKSYEVTDERSLLTIPSENMENGVYIYKMECNGRIIGSKKMIVIR